jgi:hypothetical protein
MPDVVPELCDKKLNKMTVSTYNTNLQPVEANLRFKCFDTTCDIGRTRGAREATFSGSFPQCVNGYIIAQSQGYDAKKYLVKNLDEGLVVIILEKQYTLDFEVQKAGQKAKQAVVSFNKNGSTKTISWPEQKQVTLTQGQYEIKTYVYDNTTIRLEGSTTQKCVDVPKSGFEGFLGATEEKCFTMDIPDQIVSLAISGGGKQNYYISESELMDSEKLIINTKSFGVPRKVEDLQDNYNNIEINNLQVSFV